MKKSKLISLCLLASFIFCSVATNAQEKETKFGYKTIGIYVSPLGSNDIFHFKSMEGGGSYANDGSYAFGLNFMYQLNNCFEVETGIDYLVHNTIYTPPYYPDIPTIKSKHKVEILSIPMTVRANFWNCFFVNGGIIWDFDISKNENYVSNQTGLGAMLGVGIKYDFDFGITIFVNPYVKMHSLVPFSSDNFHERILGNGIRIGVTYDIGK